MHLSIPSPSPRLPPCLPDVDPFPGEPIGILSTYHSIRQTIPGSFDLFTQICGVCVADRSRPRVAPAGARLNCILERRDALTHVRTCDTHIHGEGQIEELTQCVYGKQDSQPPAHVRPRSGPEVSDLTQGVQ